MALSRQKETLQGTKGRGGGGECDRSSNGHTRVHGAKYSLDWCRPRTSSIATRLPCNASV